MSGGMDGCGVEEEGRIICNGAAKVRYVAV
jgi:hypothetical protein